MWARFLPERSATLNRGCRLGLAQLNN